MWKKLQHSNVVQLRDAFTTKIFNDNCKFFINLHCNGNNVTKID